MGRVIDQFSTAPKALKFLQSFHFTSNIKTPCILKWVDEREDMLPSWLRDLEWPLHIEDTIKKA